MIKNKLEILRKKLNDMVIKDNVEKEELQRISEEVDVEVVQFMKDSLEKQRTVEKSISMEEVEELLKSLQIFKRIYTTLRIVDPINKKVLKLVDGDLHIYESSCYEFWKHNQVCDNCISAIAYKQNDTIFKLEIKEDNVYMVMAIPILLGEKRLVLEMLKNTLNTLYISNENFSYNNLTSVINYLNDSTKHIKSR